MVTNYDMTNNELCIEIPDFHSDVLLENSCVP